MGLLTAFLGPIASAMEPNVLLAEVRVALRDGAVIEVTDGGAPVTRRLRLLLAQFPEAASLSSYLCELTWDGVAAGPVDTSAWREVWPGAGVRFDTSRPPSSTEYSGCATLEPSRFGPDPIATFGAAGWNIGFGPLTPRLAVQCGLSGREADDAVAAWLWMDGARPFPFGVAKVQAIDDRGALTGETVPDVAAASAAPDGLYELQGCQSGLGL